MNINLTLSDRLSSDLEIIVINDDMLDQLVDQLYAGELELNS